MNLKTKPVRQESLYFNSQDQVQEHLNSTPSISHVLCPLAHFQQTFGGKIYDVYVYPVCKGGDLSEYMARKRPIGEILKSIFLQTSERNH